jgi:hypothetical protein
VLGSDAQGAMTDVRCFLTRWELASVELVEVVITSDCLTACPDCCIAVLSLGSKPDPAGSQGIPRKLVDENLATLIVPLEAAFLGMGGILVSHRDDEGRASGVREDSGGAP